MERQRSLMAVWARFYKRLSLRQIIWISFSLTALLAAVFTTVSVYGRFSSQFEQTIRQENQALIEQVCNNCAAYLRGMMKVSDALHYSVIKKTDLESHSVSDSFALLYDTNKENIQSIALFSQDGRLLESAPAATLRPDADVTSREWYALAMESSENMHFSSPTVERLFATGDSDYTWVIPLSRAVQITRGSRVESGVLLINLRYSGLKDIFDNVLLGNDAYLYLTDASGALLYHPMLQLIGAGRMAENNLEASRHRDGNYYEDFAGQRRDIAVKTVGYTGWKIVGVTPRGSVTLSTQKNLLFVAFLILFCLVMLVVINSYISRRVSGPIRELEQSVKGLEEGDWDAEIRVSGFYEVRHLGAAIGDMAGRIKQLMRDIVVEHESKRKSELSALQNQINPHFLYNTLDIIVWMIENERKTEAVRVVTALARFFRISLSRGKNVVTVADEVEHVRNYLTIQEMRYKNRFHYTFDVEEGVAGLGTIKLILQPLVENAIYHAMEFMDGDGEILLRVRREGEALVFLVRDNGCGMTADTVDKLLTGASPQSGRGSGVGVRNVQERIRLVFGPDYGLTVVSELDVGTDVLIRIPALPYEELLQRGVE